MPKTAKPKKLLLRKNFSLQVLSKKGKVCQTQPTTLKSASSARSGVEKVGKRFEWRFSEVLLRGSDILHAQPPEQSRMNPKWFLNQILGLNWLYLFWF